MRSQEKLCHTNIIMAIFEKLYQRQRSYLARYLKATLLEAFAYASNKKFRCKVLSGEASYNLCINSDFTLSCNCNDIFGIGKLGDLDKNNLAEIFSAEKAIYFRNSLAKGRLPIVNCALCSDLQIVEKQVAQLAIRSFHLPNKALMIENTVKCNLQCLSCDRRKIEQLRKKKELSLSDLVRIAGIVRDNNIKEIYYFNLGEPFLSNSIREEIQIIRNENPTVEVVTSTNGLVIDSDYKRTAALLFDTVIFSIHGSTQKSLTRYQRNGDFNKAYENMKNLVSYRDQANQKKPIIIWKYALFRWNDSETLIKKAIDLAKEARVDEIHFEKTKSPLNGISIKHHLGLGYLNKISQANKGTFKINIHTK